MPYGRIDKDSGIEELQFIDNKINEEKQKLNKTKKALENNVLDTLEDDITNFKLSYDNFMKKKNKLNDKRKEFLGILKKYYSCKK